MQEDDEIQPGIKYGIIYDSCGLMQEDDEIQPMAARGVPGRSCGLMQEDDEIQQQRRYTVNEQVAA